MFLRTDTRSRCCPVRLSRRLAPLPVVLGSPTICSRCDRSVATQLTFQAVVRSEAKPFGEARSYLPALKAATKWAAIEQSWGYARALASELSWRRDIGAPSSPSVAEGAVSTAGGASAAAAAAVAPTAGASPSPAASAGAGADAGVVEEQDVSDLYCICRGGDYGGVMVECDACSEWYHAAW